MDNQDKIEINVNNGDNFHISKETYIQWLKQSLEIKLNQEKYEECVELREKIKSLESK
jgi:protein-arginine kinase activator protein McsA